MDVQWMRCALSFMVDTECTLWQRHEGRVTEGLLGMSVGLS